MYNDDEVFQMYLLSLSVTQLRKSDVRAAYCYIGILIFLI